MGWIGCVAKNSDATSLHELLHLFGPFCTEFRKGTERSQMHQNSTKHTKTSVWGLMGWTWYVHCEKFRRDFVARTFCTRSTRFAPSFVRQTNIPNAPKKYEMHLNNSVRSNGEDRVRSLRKILTRLRGTNFCTSSARQSRMQPNSTKLTKTSV